MNNKILSLMLTGVLGASLVCATAPTVAHAQGSMSTQSTSTKTTSLKFDASRANSAGFRVILYWQQNIEGIEVQYSETSDFKDSKIAFRKAASKKENVPKDFSLGITELKQNKKYYIRARIVEKDQSRGPWSKSVTGVTKSRAPHEISNTKATKLNDGRVKLTWKHNTEFTTSIRLNMAKTYFDSGKKGTNHISVKLPKNATSYVISKEQLQEMKVPIGSGREFYYRLHAENAGDYDKRLRYNKRGIASAGQPQGNFSGGTTVSFGSFNITSQSADGVKGKWSTRLNNIAQQIVYSNTGIISLQESTTGSSKPSEVLKKVKQYEKKKKGADAKWKLVRSTRYIKPGQNGGSDGQRILYDANKYKLLSKCKDTTGSGKNNKYSKTCVKKLPRVGGAANQKFVNYALFQDRKTKQKFWVFSTHLEHRDGAKYDKNRKAQMDTILKLEKSLNKSKFPSFIIGDLNSSNKRENNYGVIDGLLNNNYVDSFTAKTVKNASYNTFNSWLKNPPKSETGYGSRIDFIFGKATNLYYSKYENIVNSRSHKASDHNMIKTTVKFK